MNGFSRIGLAAIGSLVLASAAMAQGAPLSPQEQAQKAVLTRRGLFELQALAFAPVGAMLRGAPFDAAAVEKAAQRLQITGGFIPQVFMLDTHTDQMPAALVTKARDGIWTNKSDFDSKAADLVKAAADLEAAAKTGDKGMTLRAAGAVGKSCGACHDQFRDK